MQHCSYLGCPLARPIQPIWQQFFALPWFALKKPSWGIFAIPSSSRHEKCGQMLETLFWLFQCSKNPLCIVFSFQIENLLLVYKFYSKYLKAKHHRIWKFIFINWFSFLKSMSILKLQHLFLQNTLQKKFKWFANFQKKNYKKNI